MSSFAKNNFFIKEVLDKDKPSLIKISIFSEDDPGKYYIHDGHHRCCAILIAGRTYLREDEYTITDWKVYSKYLEINFEKGWITPFHPKFEVRVANTSKFRKHIKKMLYISQDRAIQSIQGLKHVYCVNRRTGHNLSNLSRSRHSICCQHDIYGNLKMYNPDGVLITRISQKKFLWYLTKNLAVQVADDAIQLNFYPKVQTVEDFYISYKENKCVVCGVDGPLSKHHIIPYEYKKYVDKKYKEHISHDVVPLCCTCHHNYEILAQKFRIEIQEEMGITVRPHEHAQHVMEKINNINEFYIKWRQHFVDNMKPQHMPEFWDVNYEIH